MRTTTGTPDFWGKNFISPESLLATKPLTKEPEDSGNEIGYEIAVYQTQNIDNKTYACYACKRFFFWGGGVGDIVVLMNIMFRRINKLTSVFYASVLLLIMNCVVTLSK